MEVIVDSYDYAKPLRVKKRPAIIGSENFRVITRHYLPSPESRIVEVVEQVLRLNDTEVAQLLESVLNDFANRHRNFREILEKSYKRIEQYVNLKDRVTPELRLLLGAYFTCEYSVEAAALFNPSMVAHPDQSDLPDGSTRFIMSFRAVGEGHISSIEFRCGIIDRHNDIFFDPISRYVGPAEIYPDKTYVRQRFKLKLNEMCACNDVTDYLFEQLPSSFTFNDLDKQIAELEGLPMFDSEHKEHAIKMALWLARSNYEIRFDPNQNISERIIFPKSETERGGIEDARFVRFADDDGSICYYATYTAFDGKLILPQLIETTDFVTFHISTLNGKAVQNKGMALFPRKIHGRYVMLSRQDGRNNHIMFSDSLYFWQESQVFQRPSQAWEFTQIGNCGSPVETEEGWLLLTHGVGPMRTYSIGLILLDLDDPSKVIGQLKEPIMIPSLSERDGYVPNVVYSCGLMIHGNELIIPYAFGDLHTRLATISLDDVFLRLHRTKMNHSTAMS